MQFFPPNSLDSRPDSHEFLERWYSKHLLAMEERPLIPPATDQPEIYRLLYLPTFAHPEVVCVTNNRGEWHAVFKQCDGLGGYDPGQLASVSTQVLSPKQASQFNRLLERMRFWKMPSFEANFGLDGTTAIFEGVKGERYHVVDRREPHGKYGRLVKFLRAKATLPWWTFW